MRRSKGGSVAAASTTSHASFSAATSTTTTLAANPRIVPKDTAYFTYRPLSNLPTPPPTYKESTTNPSWHDSLSGLPSHYRGPAIHLVNLIPSCASLASPSVATVQAILGRANLPLETVALAVCILDSLDTLFARKWRIACPLRSESSYKRHSLPSPNLSNAQLHIDAVGPEVIVLAAIVIAVKFTEDPEQGTQHYCDVWGHGQWSHRQLNTTERCIMENLNYRILPLCNEELIADAMVDMDFAGSYEYEYQFGLPTPPDSEDSDDAYDHAYYPGHSRSQTVGGGLGLGISWAM